MTSWQASSPHNPFTRFPWIYNGDLGVVRSIDPEASEMVIDFDGREVIFGFGELDEIVLAYATPSTSRKAPSARPWSFR